MHEGARITAAMIVIADEVLSGRTLDRNTQQLALWLAGEGIELRFACVVPDERAAIVAMVRQCVPLYDHVFTSGGIGPTHDDISIAAIGDALDRPLERNADAEALLRDHYGGGISDVQLKLADLPRGTEILPSEGKGAGALRVGNVLILAGVPQVAASMLESLRGKLGGGTPLLTLTIGTRLREEVFADNLEALQTQHPLCRIASYPLWRTGDDGANIVVRSRDGVALERCVDALRAMIRSLRGEPVDGGIARDDASERN